MTLAKVIYETHKMDNRSFPLIFHDTRVVKRENCANWHDNIELLCFTKGEGVLHIDGNVMSVHGGDVAVINLEQIHSVSSSSSIYYYCLIIDNNFLVDNGINIFEFRFAELISDPVLFEKICNVAPKLVDIKQGRSGMTSVPTVRYELLGILIYLCENHLSENDLHNNKNDRAYNAVKNIIQYIRQTSGKVSLDEIAEYAQMSKYHMSREFKRVTGTTLFEYINIFRCERAKRMLYSGATVSEAAIEVGFDNMSYFSRTFKRYMGKLPSECQKSKKQV